MARTPFPLLLVLICACADRPQARMQNADTLTQRQKDSVVGASGLPGSQGIAKAQKAQDAENRRSGVSDSMSRDST